VQRWDHLDYDLDWATGGELECIAQQDQDTLWYPLSVLHDVICIVETMELCLKTDSLTFCFVHLYAHNLFYRVKHIKGLYFLGEFILFDIGVVRQVLNHEFH
jgi:hypothetical protein